MLTAVGTTCVTQWTASGPTSRRDNRTDARAPANSTRLPVEKLMRYSHVGDLLGVSRRAAASDKDPCAEIY